MKITQIEENLHKVIKPLKKESFIYDLLLSYGLPKASITRLRKGNLNLSKNNGEVSWKKKVLFREVLEDDLHLVVSNMEKEANHDQRFIVTTDWETLLAIDSKTDEKLDIELKDLPKYYDFFLPWAGMEKHQHQGENPADVKAAVKMAKLFDEIKKDNPDNSPEAIHNLNIFLSRLLFCFFAEDTNIFSEHQFTNAISSHTQQDGNDLDDYLNQLFDILDTPKEKRKNLPEFLNAFPYANGGLFNERIDAPKFTRKSRQAIIDSGELNWSAINPDIFGSMFQAVISADQRGNLGQHYTSVTNIMKVIEPLFLNALKEELEKAKGSEKKLKKLLIRLRHIKIFDPACGSGNFLIIAYKELRRLEIQVIEEIRIIKGTAGMGRLDFGSEFLSQISLNNFYGIELDDFAHEISKLALWLAEHQMNMEFFKAFGKTNPTLPLKDAGQITRGNACRLDWEDVCPKEDGFEVFILGNPPYRGARFQDSEQKKDMDIVLKDLPKYRDLDYIACWFYKGSKYIKGANSKLAFVSTNSICQGLQVGLLWPSIFKHGLEIDFAHTSFKWENNAKGNAAVIVVVVGIRNENSEPKFLFDNGLAKSVKSINAYLTDGSSVVVARRSKPLSFSYEMSFGNMPNDGGGLILSESDRNQLLHEYPEAKKFVKQLYGAAEFIKGQIRYCLWIDDADLLEAENIPIIQDRIERTKTHRLESKDKGTNKLAQRSHQFRDTNVSNQSQIIVPRVSSERREYIPTGFLGTNVVVSDSAQVIYDGPPWLLSVLNSKMHMLWLKNVGGKLKSDYRYAKDLVYNTFPFPSISNQRQEELTQAALRILEVREKFSEMTMSLLYDPNKMPAELKEAHTLNDLAVDRCYRSAPFEDENKRLEYLFKLYEKMIAEEKEHNTLFEKRNPPAGRAGKSRKQKKK